MEKRNYVNMNVNPCKMCMPMGGSLALKGIEASMIIIHGSQGCSTYIRRHIAAHYNEPVDIASSSLSEEGTVYGGANNLKLGITNLIKLYNPKLIGVLTTCLAETIGEDIEGIIAEYNKETGNTIKIVPVPTPGYNASQYEGYFFALRKIVEKLATDNITHQKINIIVSDVTCEEIRELKALVRAFKLEPIIFPDISDALDAPYTQNYSKLSAEGTSIEDIQSMGGSRATIEFGQFVKEEHSPGSYLEEKYGVPLYRMPLPIGLKHTDYFMEVLAKLSGKAIPYAIRRQRGRMLDAMVDSHKHNRRGRAAVYGEIELMYSISSLCLENGIEPRLLLTGTANERFRQEMEAKLIEADILGKVLEDSDFETLASMTPDYEINLLIGNSDGKFIREKQDIEMIRVGFPIHDQIGAQRKMYIGYKGSVALLDEMTNTLIDQKYRYYRKDMLDTHCVQEDIIG